MTGAPFAHLNLRRNPFGEPPSDDLPGLVLAPVEELASWLGEASRHSRRAIQVTGEEGRGKTAHLHALRSRFPEAPYVYLGEGEPLPPLPAGPIFFLDEAQRLPRRLRRRLFRRVERLALATHEDFATELTAAGLEVRRLSAGGLDPQRLAAILDRRLAWARRGPGPVPRVTAAGLIRLLERFGDDLRAILDHLYEVYQTLPGVVPVEPCG